MKCTCGAAAIKATTHSEWCDLVIISTPPQSEKKDPYAWLRDFLIQRDVEVAERYFKIINQKPDQESEPVQWVSYKSSMI